MWSSRLWTVALGLAAFLGGGMGLYHFFLPVHMRWREGLGGTVDMLVWALFTLNFSWSLIVVLSELLVLRAARLGPAAGSFVRRTVFTLGLFWLIHGIYTWIVPMPLPASTLWLRWVLGVFPAVVAALHWVPLWVYRGASDMGGPS